MRTLISKNGSALPLAMVFAAIGIVTVLVFMRSEHSLTMSSVKDPHKKQAFLTAKAGVWATLKELVDTSSTDSLDPINTLDSLFGRELFDSVILLDTSVFPQEPLALIPFSTDSFGTCTTTVTPNGFSILVESRGIFRENERTVRADIAGFLFPSSDTTMFLAKGDRPSGGFFEGEACRIDQLPEERKRLFTVRKKELDAALQEYHDALFATVDTGFAKGMEMVQSNSDFHDLPETVEGDLFIDGAMRWIEIETDRSINVLGNVQITGGDVILKGLELIVNGTVNIFDKAVLEDVSLFARSEIMIGGQATVTGKVISQSKIVTFGDVTLGPDAVLLVTGEEAKEGQPGEGASPPPPSGTPPQPFSLFVSDRSQVDGTLIALGSRGGIKTDAEAVVKGIMWAEGPMCHQGELKGVLRADMLIDCTQPITPPPQTNESPEERADTTGGNSQSKESSAGKIAKVVQNVLLGQVSVNQDISKYSLPFFLGTYRVVSWREP